MGRWVLLAFSELFVESMNELTSNRRNIMKNFKNTIIGILKIAISSAIPLALAYCVNDYYKGNYYNDYSATVPYSVLLGMAGITYYNLFMD